MARLQAFVTCFLSLVLMSCGGGDWTPPLSQGLKIFVSAGVHGADFANDPYLTGGDAISKADAFCSTDPNKPSSATYKALIVDGVLRDAKTRTNWVLQPSTKYYRVHGNVEIGTTTPSAIFGSAYQPLTNAVTDALPPGNMDSGVWTGIGNAADFSVAADSCAGWSTMTISHTTTTAAPWATDGGAFSGGMFSCASFQFHLYCVEQP